MRKKGSVEVVLSSSSSFSKKSRSFEGKTRVVVVSPQKSRSSFRDFGGRVLHRFCREVCTLYVLFQKNVSKMSRVFRPIIFLIN